MQRLTLLYKYAIRSTLIMTVQIMGDLAADRPAWWLWAYLGLKSAANDLPYTSQVALGLFGQCNAQASKVAHYVQANSETQLADHLDRCKRRSAPRPNSHTGRESLEPSRVAQDSI